VVGVGLEQPGAGGLQPAYHRGVEPPAKLVAEDRVPVAGRADRPGLELEPLHRLRGDRAEPPLVRRGQPGQAEHVAPAQRPDDQPALAGDRRVQCDLPGVNEPEPVGGGALLEDALPRWHHDVLAQHAQLAQLIIGEPAQERLRPQNRLLLCCHAEPPPAAPAPPRDRGPTHPGRAQNRPPTGPGPPPHPSHPARLSHAKALARTYPSFGLHKPGESGAGNEPNEGKVKMIKEIRRRRRGVSCGRRRPGRWRG
jgi:hypothetical protein